MLIGNRERFALELAPVTPSWELRYEPEAAAWAGLGVWVAGRNLCAHVVEGSEELRTAFYVPLGPVADWFVRSYSGILLEERVPWFPSTWQLHDAVRKWGEAPPPVGEEVGAWLDRREAFWSRHFLVAGAEGAWLPNMAFLREDDDMLIVWAPPQFASGPRVTCVSDHGSARVLWRDVDDVLTRFVDEVAKAFELKRLAPYGWIESAAPRLSRAAGTALDSIPLFCARTLQDVAEFLGVPEGDVAGALGEDAARDPSSSPLLQVLRDLPPRPSPGLGPEAMSTVRASAEKRDRGCAKSWEEARTLALDAARAGTSAEEAGQLAARSLRDALQLNGQPIVSTEETLHRFGVGIRLTNAKAEHEQMVLAAAAGGVPMATVLNTARTGTSWGRRFEHARALGHAVLDPLRSGALGAATTPWAQATRRRRSGAFAAELLLPLSACDEASDGHLDGVYAEQRFEALLQRYDVGAKTAAFQLYNHRRLSRAIRDELIDRHARD